MCGRFVLLTDLSVITESFNIQNVACEYRPGNNIRNLSMKMRHSRQQFSVAPDRFLEAPVC